MSKLETINQITNERFAYQIVSDEKSVSLVAGDQVIKFNSNTNIADLTDELSKDFGVISGIASAARPKKAKPGRRKSKKFSTKGSPHFGPELIAKAAKVCLSMDFKKEVINSANFTVRYNKALNRSISPVSGGIYLNKLRVAGILNPTVPGQYEVNNSNQTVVKLREKARAATA